MKGFLNRWSVTIVMIPALVGMHWGWFVLHKNEALVPKHQQKDELPIVSVISEEWQNRGEGDLNDFFFFSF